MKIKKTKGFTLIETLAAVTVGAAVTATALSIESDENRKRESIKLITDAYSIVQAVDHRIAIDGYDSTLWTKTDWASEDNIVVDLIGKELNSSYLTNCPGGTWNPSIITEQKTKLIECRKWESRKKNGEKISASLTSDVSGFLQNFKLRIEYPVLEDLQKSYLDLKYAITNIKSTEQQQLSGVHMATFVSKSTGSEIGSKKCVQDFNDCSIELSWNRSGGNEYVRADGENSMVASHLTFVESKGDSPMKCIRWQNTLRDGSGVWSRELAEDCGIGIYKGTTTPVMVETTVDTGTFKNILLDQECNDYRWDGTKVIDVGTTSPCGMNNDGTEIYQVVPNISSETAHIKNIYSDALELEDLNVKNLISNYISTQQIDVLNKLKTNLIESYSGTKVYVNSDMTLKEVLIAEKDIYIHGDTYIGKNVILTGGIQAKQNIQSEGSIIADLSLVSTEQLELRKVNTENSSCSVNGALSRESNGALLSCVSGVWELAIKESTPIGTVAMWASSSLPTGWIEMNGQSTSSYPKLRSIIGNNVPDLRGQFVRGWDHGRGLDSGRSLKSTQGDAIRNITGSAGFGATGGGNGYSSGAFTQSYYRYSERGGNKNGTMINFDASRVVPTAGENRPKNITLMYIIKAK